MTRLIHDWYRSRKGEWEDAVALARQWNCTVEEMRYILGRAAAEEP